MIDYLNNSDIQVEPVDSAVSCYVTKFGQDAVNLTNTIAGKELREFKSLLNLYSHAVVESITEAHVMFVFGGPMLKEEPVYEHINKFCGPRGHYVK